EFLKGSKGVWVLPIVFATPFLCIHLIIMNLDNVKIINYTFQSLYKAVGNKMIFIISTVLIMVISFISIFAVPYCFFQRKKSIKTLLTSLSMIFKHGRTSWIGLLFANIIIFVFNYILYFVALFLAGIYIWLTKDSTFVLGAVLSISEWIRMVMTIVSAAIGFVVNLALLYGMYMRYVDEKELDQKNLSPFDKNLFLVHVKQRKVAVFLSIIILFAESIYFVGTFRNTNKISENIMDTVKVTAHRGGAQLAPENTIPALEKSIELLSDYAEIDVQETKDGELILMHDNNLKRTTGIKKNVWEVTYDEIKNQDIISKKSEFENIKIPTLREVLEVCNHRLNLNIEVKYNGRNDGIIKKVIDLIEEMEFEDQCVITSMNYKYLKEVKELNPNIRTGYIMTMTYGSVSNIEAADFFSVKWTYVNEKFIKEAHLYGKEVHAWTVNSKGTLERMKVLSVDNVITDNPTLAREVMIAKPTNASLLDILRYVFK
ncbi:MAG TPA: glycerophosphodiester phosphodiesterase, partial [Candidatus Merdenecus merdavium]|nr:glycerophosphodiester phosphodiesterase [Candidatus Merdenecus merdavium]